MKAVIDAVGSFPGECLTLFSFPYILVPLMCSDSPFIKKKIKQCNIDLISIKIERASGSVIKNSNLERSKLLDQQPVKNVGEGSG